MLIALCLFKYFPYGGLQRDFLAIGKELYKRGHQIRVYTRSWQGDKPSEFDIIEVPVRAFSNHSANERYYEWVKKHLDKHPVNKIVGFNKMPGLDYYYAADVCYIKKTLLEKKGIFYRLTARYHHYCNYEKFVFKPSSSTKILALTEQQILDYQTHYKTQSQRFYLLPPGISKDRKYNNLPKCNKAQLCNELKISNCKTILLQVGSAFHRKGVDRSIEALSSLPSNEREQTHLIVIGQDDQAQFLKLAQKKKVSHLVHFFEGRDDIPKFIACADLLLHPARSETAGIVILEALVGGLPQIVTEECGYSTYVKFANSGIVLQTPFDQTKFNLELEKYITNSEKEKYSTNAKIWADSHDMYSLPTKAADVILNT